jgi:hypothetical protein
MSVVSLTRIEPRLCEKVPTYVYTLTTHRTNTRHVEDICHVSQRRTTAIQIRIPKYGPKKSYASILDTHLVGMLSSPQNSTQQQQKLH